ncbi:glycosyltransferase family 2 protein [Salipiger sp.]|uniref:glycosyltransferase family 2 protein n=1 Tax=Salipiger sp. TaxID=2078585 RepID=UPI003A97EF7F
MSQDPERRPSYAGGIDTVLTRMEARRDPIAAAEGEGLPPLDIALGALTAADVNDPDLDPAEAPPFRSPYHRKRHALRKELAGESELVCLHALLIAHLRKCAYPDHAPALFRRLWAEEGAHLIARLDPRWKVSAITTFGDHGATPVQRSVGLALSVLFGTMKLYESERLYSGAPPDQPFALDNRTRGRLPMQMNAWSLTDGGLDVNMLGRLWTEAEGDALIRPLAHDLLDSLLHDDRTVFRRLMTMRQRHLKRIDPDPERPRAVVPVPQPARPIPAERLRWGVVSTIRAPLPAIARFAAHHLELGADSLHIYLDTPDPEAEAWLSRHPALHITPCDDAYWQTAGKARMEAHQQRQAFNATRCLHDRSHGLDWLAHIDVDEFLLTERPLRAMLAGVSPHAAAARILPAEALATETGFPSHYKLAHHHAGQKKSVVQDIYPTFGLHLYGGFLSHTAGKVFARTGLDDTRLGIHTVKYRGGDASNRDRLHGVHVGHHHAPSWEHFRRHLAFRRTRGSYRTISRRKEMGQAQILTFLLENEGDAGLRALFDEVCADTPALRDRLAAHGMLLTHPLDPDSAVRRIFGDLP